MFDIMVENCGRRKAFILSFQDYHKCKTDIFNILRQYLHENYMKIIISFIFIITND